MNRWQLLVGLLLAFLFIPQEARAECAWVMWSKVETTQSQKDEFPTFGQWWEIVQALETSEQCDVFMEAYHSRMVRFHEEKKVWDVMKASPSHISIRRKGGGPGVFVQSWTYFCLPDTVDPREKKE